MSVTVAKEELLQVIQKAYPLAPTKSSLQILSNLKLSCAESELKVIATDLDQSIACVGAVDGKGGFDVALNARKLFDIVREMPSGSITIENDGNVLSLVSEKGFSCKVAGADVGDFPAFPEVGEAVDFELPLTEFRRMVGNSSFAVSKDTTRSCLCGILWEIEPQRCTMVATDGHRLGRSYFEYASGVAQKVSAIVPQKSLLHLARIAEEDEGGEQARIKVSVGEKYVVMEGARFTLCSKRIEGPYPDYEKVIPKNNPKNAVVDRALLLDAVRRVSVLSNQKTHLVKFKFTSDSLEIRVVNRDIGGEAREVVPVEYTGEDHSIGFNGLYFSEMLGICPTEKIALEMNTQISACLIVPMDSETGSAMERELFLIMPLRLMDET